MRREDNRASCKKISTLPGNKRNKEFNMVMTGLVTAIVVAAAGMVCAENAAAPIAWYDASKFTIEGRGWDTTESFYNRLPASAKSVVRDSVWALSADTAGIVVRFSSDASEIRVRWTLTSSNLAMNHMAATGVSGVDLYIWDRGRWRWLAVGRPSAQTSEVTLISALPPAHHEFALYLPLYNGIAGLKLGVPQNAHIGSGAPRPKGTKPVVFYGTSITQGGCASRPGMAYPAIIGRRLDIPTINLGFSGNGQTEPEMAELLAQLDPAAYVIDPLANMHSVPVVERIGNLLKVLRVKHPETPVILMESAGNQNSFVRSGKFTSDNALNRDLRKVYTEEKPVWGDKLFYVKGDKLAGTDGEGTVDGVHATDLGFQRMAEILTPIIKKALAK